MRKSSDGDKGLYYDNSFMSNLLRWCKRIPIKFQFIIDIIDCRLLVHFRGTDVGEAIEPEGCSSRNLPNDVTRALIEYYLIRFIDKTCTEGEAPPLLEPSGIMPVA